MRKIQKKKFSRSSHIHTGGTKIRKIVNSTIYRENQLSEFFSNASEENEEFLAFLLLIALFVHFHSNVQVTDDDKKIVFLCFFCKDR